MTEQGPIAEHYLAEYERVATGLAGSAGTARARKRSLEAFAAAGFPHARLEDWKYTSLAALEKRRFTLADAPGRVSQHDIEAFLPAELDGYRVVVVDGHYQVDLARLEGVPDGVHITSFADYLDRDDSAAIKLSHANGDSDSLADMNTAFVTDGVHVHVDKNVSLDKPLHILCLASGGDDNRMHQVRHRIALDTGAELTVIEHYAGLGDAPYFTNSVTEVTTAANSRLTRVRVQQESSRGYHIGHLFALQSRDSRVHDHAFDFGGRLSRTGTNVHLAENNAEIHLYGVYMPTGRQHIDNHTRVDHATEHGISREIYKGVLADHGRGVFNGKVVVHPNAQKTDSDQAANALLLSDKAEVDAKPELEIYADDVVCGHGSTVGQLDESAVFYLKSRGVNDAGARAILTYSFAKSLVELVGIASLERFIEAALLAKLPGGDVYADLA